MIGFAPCGACGTYVPSTIGCEHWDVSKMAKTAVSEYARRQRYRRWAERQKQKKESSR